MENSMSSISHAVPCDRGSSEIEYSEESSWTTYLVDFMLNNNQLPSSPSDSDSYFMASDVSSSIDQSIHKQSCNGLSFNKRKSKKVMVDDSLEDTASSPVNSPKLSNFYHHGMNQKQKGNREFFKEKGNPKKVDEMRCEVGDVIGRESECSISLKEKGLCLVPLSMAVNFIG